MAIHNAPSHATTFFGRQSELNDLSELLAGPKSRLLSLTGLGGIGKTRLALVLADQIQHSFPDGVHFVPLQPLQSPDQIIPTVSAVLGLQADQNPRDQLLNWLRDRHLLLVLDNFEHMMEGVDLLADILETAPHVKLLVTSRDALRLRGEWLRPLDGLDYPDAASAATDTDYGAIQLFIERARQQGSNLNIKTQYWNIVRICQLIEGIPLALELAAGWVKSLSCAEIVSELEKSIAILKSHTRDMPTRHRSMEAVFAQSWSLLNDEERMVLKGFSVFRGGSTRDAAEQVIGATLPVLTSLVDKSLLRHDSDRGRFDLNELLRQYAAQNLDQTPEVKEKVADQHSTYYTAYLHQYDATIHLSDQAHVLVELDNVRVAWKRAAQQHNQTALLRAAPSLYWLYHFQGWFEEGTAMFYLAEEAVRRLPVTDDSRFLLGMMQLFRGYYMLRQSGQSTLPPVDVEATLSLWKDLEERPEMGLPLSRAIFMLLTKHSDPGQIVVIARKSFDFHQRYEDLAGMAIALTTLASVYYEAFAAFAEAQQFIKQALVIDRQIGFELNAGWSESILGTITHLQGNYEQTKAHAVAWVAYRQRSGILSALDTALHVLGHAALELGDDVAAKTHFEESIKVASQQQRQGVVAKGRASLGIMAALQGNMHGAAAQYADSQDDLRSAGLKTLNYNEEPESLGFLALLLGHYDHALAHYEATLTHYRDTGYRVPLMCAHCRAGHALIGLGNQIRAKVYLFEALREAANMGAYQVLLEALLGIAQLSIIPPTLAIELLVLVCRHPTSNRYSRTQAKGLLATVEFSLAQAELRAALERGQTLTPETAVIRVEPFGSDLQPTQFAINQPLIDPLSQRELEVLTLVAEVHTNQEIADRLSISVSTVKKHINHIYGKLDVTHRAQAVACARTLKILA